jgi:hypothetical protein
MTTDPLLDEPRRHAFLSLAAAVAFAAATVALFIVSRGKWSDALVDSGNVWIVPFTIASGGLLYRDVVHWFGPFTPYFHAAFFEVLGSSFRTLAVAGVVGSIGALAAHYVALRTVTEKTEAALWTALAVPALVFMPNAGGSILGMGYRMWHAAAFAMLAVAAVSRVKARRPLAAATAGTFGALAGLCRTEWGIATLVSCAVALAVAERGLFNRALIRNVLVAVATALVIFGGVLGFFVASAGFDAVLRDGPILLFGLPEETRSNVVFAGLRGWKSGVVPLAYSVLLWVGVALTVEVVARRREDREKTRRRLSGVLGILAILAVLSLVARGTGPVIFSAAPVVCLASLVAGLRRRGRPEAAMLAGFGVLGLLVSHRVLFHLSDGPYVAPPLLVAFVCAAGLLRLFATRAAEGAEYRPLATGLIAVVAALVLFAFTGRFLHYASDERVPVAGTQRMLSARPETALELAALAEAIRRDTKEGDGLVVFPEGEILNYLSGRPNPLRHKLYLPGYVSRDNEESIIAEIERWKPRAIVVWPRPLGEYGAGEFGKDYGTRIQQVLAQAYERRTVSPSGATGRSRAIFAIRND